MEENFPVNDIANVPVIDRLSALLLTVNECPPHIESVLLSTKTNLIGVWLILMITADVMLYYSTSNTMSL